MRSALYVGGLGIALTAAIGIVEMSVHKKGKEPVAGYFQAFDAYARGKLSGSTTIDMNALNADLRRAAEIEDPEERTIGIEAVKEKYGEEAFSIAVERAMYSRQIGKDPIKEYSKDPQYAIELPEVQEELAFSLRTSAIRGSDEYKDADRDIRKAAATPNYQKRISALESMSHIYPAEIISQATMDIAFEFGFGGDMAVLKYIESNTPIYAFIKVPVFQEAVAVSLIAERLKYNLENETKAAEELSNKWEDYRGNKPMIEFYRDLKRGAIVQTPAGPMRIDRPEYREQWNRDSEVTSSRSYRTERGGSVVTERISPGRDASEQRAQEWRQEQYNAARDDFNRGIQAGKAAASQAAGQAAQGIGNAIGNIFAPKK